MDKKTIFQCVNLFLFIVDSMVKKKFELSVDSLILTEYFNNVDYIRINGFCESSEIE